MKKFIIAVLTVGLLFAATPAQAAKHYSTCSSLNAKYKHGVGLKGKKNKVIPRNGGKVRYERSAHKVSSALYKANKKLDRDKDGIACER